MSQLRIKRIKDNNSNGKEEFSEVSNIVDRVADKTLGQLANEGIFVFPELISEAKDISDDQHVLRSENESYLSGNIMGFLGCGDERLVIESRFSSEGDHDYFLQYLLERVLGLPNIIELEIDTNQDNNLFHFFLFLFPYYLKKATRKGIFKSYIRHQYNDSNIKGAIEIARHIKTNTPFVGNIAYSQREYSYDNYLTELVRHTIEFIKNKPYGSRLLSKAKDEVSLIVNATQDYKFFDRQKWISKNKQNPLGHAYYREYRNLQHLCLMILQYKKSQIGPSSHQIFGMLFDGAWLWEEYVNSIIKDIFHHPMNNTKEGGQHLFDGSRVRGLIYPDFIGRNSENRVIGDAKYKPTANIFGKDYLQLLAYMFRFDAKQGFYFYPEDGTEENVELWLNSGTTYQKNVKRREDISVIKCGLKIPSGAESYDSFTKKMKDSENEFLNSIA